MRANIIVLLISSIIGILLGCLVAKTVLTSFSQTADGGAFESLDHLRQEMTKSDSRDLKHDRSVSLRSIITPHPSDSIIYTLRPNLDVRFQKVSVKTNSHGMRGPERPKEKAQGVYRIALLGDSYAFGWGVEQQHIFAQVIEDSLNSQQEKYSSIEVLNFGVPGYSTFQEVAAFRETGLSFDPDMVLVFLVDNDFGLPFYIRDLSKPEALMPEMKFRKISPTIKNPEKLEKYHRMLQLIDANRALEELAQLGKEHELGVFLVINPKKNWKKELNKLTVLQKVPSIRLLHIREQYIDHINSNKIDHKLLSLAGDPHPSALRHRLLGELIAAELQPYVAGTVAEGK